MFVCVQVESRSDYMSADTESSGSGTANQALFSEKVKQSQDAIQRGDFNSAVTHYTDAIQLDPVRTQHSLRSVQVRNRLQQTP